MTRKSPSLKSRKTVSPLLGTLLQTEPAPPAANQPHLLKAYVALDALHRGSATPGLLTILGQHFLVAERLCVMGYLTAALRAIREGHAALVRVDLAAEGGPTRHAARDDYLILCRAVSVYEQQLRQASHRAVLDAEYTALQTLLQAHSACTVPA
ncbi:hypothetical protein P5X00_36805 [Paraburkholderia sp. A2RO-4L]|uniref:hypothetical protein n=1 Tax=Paraburkholderia sp. A2RO-4L TaxID=3028374 RepID=UPI003DA9016A